MQFNDVVQQRQSIRKFMDSEIPDEDIIDIVKLANSAPSAMNIQNWHFVVIKKQEFKKEIGNIITAKNESIARQIDHLDKNQADKFRKFCSKFSLFPTEAPAMVVVFSDVYAPPENKIFEMISTDDAKTEMEKVMYLQNPAMQGLGAAINTFLLSAVDRGLGGCWLTSANYASDEITALLKNRLAIEKYGFMAAILAIGIPEGESKSPQKLPVEEVLTII